jgi:hypothetical protein
MGCRPAWRGKDYPTGELGVPNSGLAGLGQCGGAKGFVVRCPADTAGQAQCGLIESFDGGWIEQGNCQPPVRCCKSMI